MAKRGRTHTKLEREFIERSIKEFRKYGKFTKVRGGGSLRGVPDYVGCVEGHYIALEYKRDKSELYKDKGRSALQEYRLEEIRKHKGFGAFIYPQNHDQVLREMLIHCGLIEL